MKSKDGMMGRFVYQMAMGAAVVVGLTGSAFAQWYINGKPAPDLDFAKSDGPFRVQLFFTNDSKAFFEVWKKPVDPVQVHFSNRAYRGKQMEVILLFTNCQAGPDGLCDATVDFVVVWPDGSIYGKFENTELWRAKPPPVKDAIQYGVQTMGVIIEPGGPDGEYRVETTVRDNVRGSTLRLTQPFWVGTAPREGG